jgi:SAM-dependent methyltransferase
MWCDPLLYELEYADDPAFDVPFWESVVRETGARRILELACGTGRLTLPLARTGAAVVGLDFSAPFLARAGEHLAAAEPGLDVQFVEADMREPQVAGPFDLVVVAFNSLAYLHTAEDQLAALRAAQALLAPGGTFAFDLVMPRFDFLAEAAASCPVVRIDADFPVPEQGLRRMIRHFADSYDAATQTLHSTNTYMLQHDDGRIEHRLNDVDWHIYFPRELEALLMAAGLQVRERYGSYDRTPWSSRSSRYLWLCSAASR